MDGVDLLFAAQSTSLPYQRRYDLPLANPGNNLVAIHEPRAVIHFHSRLSVSFDDATRNDIPIPTEHTTTVCTFSLLQSPHQLRSLTPQEQKQNTVNKQLAADF